MAVMLKFLKRIIGELTHEELDGITNDSGNQPVCLNEINYGKRD
jgi:hypothetical protein